MTLDLNNLSLLANTVRFLAIDGVQKANSGHPGMPMGAADYATVVWANYLRFNPKDPHWPNRDRFVLSAGHGSMLLYSLLHVFGYDLPLSELKSFRQWGSKTPGHPEFPLTPGVETTTGPLGAGVSNGVGLALSGKMLQARFSEELFNYRVFGIVSDGDLMEGVASEAASLAGHLGLDNLIYLYDDNEISIGGNTNITFTESVPERFKAYGWHVETVNGHDHAAISGAIDRALAVKGKPKLISCTSIIGYGSPKKAGTSHVHGEPLGVDEVKATKAALKWPEQPDFYIPEQVGKFCCDLAGKKFGEYETWRSKFEKWAKEQPELYSTFKKQAEREIPAALKDELIKTYTVGEQKKLATRELSGQVLNIMAKHLPGLVGGSADLEPSTKTLLKDTTDIQPNSFKGRNLRFGVREHGMGGVANGLAYCRSWIPYTATFLVFSDYMRPTLRLAAISHLQTLFIFTHDSFYLGEDGPTHQPIEHAMSLRLIPNLYVFRPADGLETAMSYYAALQKKNSPSTLFFTRQGLPALVRPASFKPEDIMKGGYIVSGSETSELVIVATGSEVSLANDAAALLAAQGVKARIVSMPCWELFLEQPQSYRDSVIPPKARKVSIEAGTTVGWETIVGSDSLRIGIDHYGASAPAEVLAQHFGFTKDAVAKRISEWNR